MSNFNYLIFVFCMIHSSLYPIVFKNFTWLKVDQKMDEINIFLAKVENFIAY
ncbi:hypothetical protein XBKQ1_2740004 [Xenorhabdus bovienii str. kraussei Quebec]|uniref:Uncharacterized protein n=1 Tax=Xenorhabdus bovienii str. kraussei Quebec TaxID=1398203 RepID=A0A077PIZ7_XENBV|nr:hypothetical protein XBFFR1_260013 [Xenorhabdus bovienii str. feltiae France]CDG92346.1 hypothetical protein XBFFL1_2160024 [Xenorhabdus bovienii str. feltiae Florida]CDH20676.1 hypothetical protein XBKQ1_2740004 [Xenorhabdus bovienii str. kraussei Quebec]